MAEHLADHEIKPTRASSKKTAGRQTGAGMGSLLSNVTPAQIAEGRRICEIVCVQNQYKVAYRNDDALIDSLAGDRIAYVPFLL
jgi:aryl-alcohol dehydrogenase-like predicted oxidoreductase